VPGSTALELVYPHPLGGHPSIYVRETGKDLALTRGHASKGWGRCAEIEGNHSLQAGGVDVAGQPNARVASARNEALDIARVTVDYAGP